MSLYLFGVSAIWAAISTPLTNLLNAVGKIKTTFKFMVGWTIATWIFVPVLAIKFGYNGIALYHALMGFSGFLVIYVIKKQIDIAIIENIKGPVISSLLMGVFSYFMINLLPHNFPSVMFIIVTSIIIYFFSLSLADREKTAFALENFRKIFKRQ